MKNIDLMRQGDSPLSLDYSPPTIVILNAAPAVFLRPACSAGRAGRGGKDLCIFVQFVRKRKCLDPRKAAKIAAFLGTTAKDNE